MKKRNVGRGILDHIYNIISKLSRNKVLQEGNAVREFQTMSAIPFQGPLITKEVPVSNSIDIEFDFLKEGRVLEQREKRRHFVKGCGCCVPQRVKAYWPTIGYYNHQLNKYFLAYFLLFNHQFCYIYGPPIRKEMSLA